MAFSDVIVRQAWKRAGVNYPPGTAYCECREQAHTHGVVRCNVPLTWENRGKNVPGGWEAHSKSGKNENSVSDCVILCWNCHLQLTPLLFLRYKQQTADPGK